MEEKQPSIFDSEIENFIKPRRKELLPWWIKVCSWFFLFMGGIGILLLLALLFGTFTMEGFETTASDAKTIMGTILFIWIALKAVTSYGLLSGKSWAINVAIADAVINLLISIFSAVYPFFDDQPGGTIQPRIEIFLLVLYLWTLHKISPQWDISRP
ncbi:hypothetical protein GFS24_05915 [Chitinophaga sp. SYP-B3965]|uniref:hypothetical protein n=1 Tax=Chitinophaga sp. SYP-B3965 TaxID=2663120 RepID=UPI001299CF5A|nr:hypothetical protein [Chitinophaga sp. SYP-B3965]MRG44639.1 hypothetical protein [Chitinophaga sp. SYP-B3965]